MYAQGALGQIIEHAGERLSENGSGVVDLLSSWLEGEANFDHSWSPLFGAGLDAIRKRSNREIEHIAASLLFHLHSHGFPGEWALTTRDESSTRWQDALLGPASRFEVHAEGGTARVTTWRSGGTDRYDFVRFHKRWDSPQAKQLPALECVVVLLGRDALHTTEFSSGSLQDAVVPQVSDLDAAHCQRGLDLIAAHGGEYLNWVLRVIREIALLAPEGNLVRSGGVAPHFGQIHMTSSPSRVLIAEMLVHEASHQYFEMMRRLDPLVESSAGAEYYSPVVRRERPLWALLKAYHAFANVELFHHALAAGRLPASEFKPVNLEQIHEDVTYLQTSLSEHACFTPLGQALFAPLCSRIERL